ncbi:MULTISPECIES: YceI family protein [unclassified Luteimonas]|uniref:YceI family protein n=1 Tax=unclassified Luteimonas TaxID=2629088 RepID=UPI0018F07FE6|nr:MULTISPECIES: YceI family protein [unclassified Luteimonas]MBJ6982056.1 polyisoprenoid-binding protein [Luteimonas sp. MC1572]MBJ7575365.1 polyisoprenoid-binding protein [Luteimonas sp. MC1828]QQO03353.1 polyisoprenoid-binding protein [Luteimonas sp. MC1572]
MTSTFNRILLAGALSLATASVFAAPLSYKMDPAHTDVIAQWSHFGYSNPIAHFGSVDGTIVYDAENIAASSVEVTLPMSGMSSHVAKFDEHLRSAELFDVANFPEATFKSTKVESAGEGKLTITGDLTIKGVTKPVVLAATINKVADHPMSKQPTAGFDATATFKRSDFGLGLYAPAVSDEVQIRITTEASVPKAK